MITSQLLPVQVSVSGLENQGGLGRRKKMKDSETAIKVKETCHQFLCVSWYSNPAISNTLFTFDNEDW